MSNSIEVFLLEIGFNWTLSKFIPYLCAIVLGFILLKLSFKLSLRFWVKIPIGICLLLLPFSSYFFFYPIYLPDLFNTTYKPKVLPQQKPKQTTLAVVVLPGCPYCIQTTEVMNRLAEQNKQLKINYYLVSEDPISAQLFRKKLNKRIAVRYTQDAALWMLAAEGVFPSYLLFDNKQLKRAWHNTTFGVRALDELRSFQ
ncbi:MAG: hypothetical protein RIR94_897 [Bacteroidota bacterium]